MTILEGPYYPLAEAAQNMDLSVTELKHHIENDELQAIVYTKPRSMLLLRKNGDGDWTGYATCNYRGHYTLHKSYVQQLLDGEDIFIGTGFGKIVNRDGISALSTSYPYKLLPPRPPITVWAAIELEELKPYLGNLSATPLPIEKEAATKKMDDLLKQFAGLIDKGDGVGSPPPSLHNGPDYVLDFKSNSEFSPPDLRVASSEIRRFLDDKAQKAKEASLLTSMQPWGRKGDSTRENQLHSMIERILTKIPSASPKQVWKIIEQDFNSDDPLFDVDCIIQHVSPETIEWSSRHGKDQTLRWNSLPPLLSKLKKRALA